MTERRTFQRKIGYGAAAVALLIPLYILSQPATLATSSAPASPGGVLAQYRQAHGLSQANLGAIDPASETMKLATLGLSPIAITLLWDKAAYFRKVEDFINLSATCEQITRLEPNFASVWEYQGWNLSYNVAVNFDDYHDRYRWIIKGVNYMREGTAYNATNSRLPWYIGWVIGQKIGRADEKTQYRKLFRQDDEFHNLDNPFRPPSERDNWLVGQWWFEKAEDVVAQGYPVKGNSALIFYDSKPKCVINYAEALEDEGIFGEVAKLAWENGRKAWFTYGARDIPTVSNDTIRLNDEERIAERMKQTKAELDELAPGLREKIREERIAKLPAKDRDLARTPRDQRHVEQLTAGDQLDAKTQVTEFDLAERVDPAQRVRAMRLAKSVADDQTTLREINLDRDQVNFVYWRERCEMEHDDETLTARKAIYQAEDALASARLDQAGRMYEEGWRAWRKSLDKYPLIGTDQITVGEINESIDKYAYYLSQNSRAFPEDFILNDQLLYHQRLNPSSAPRKHVPKLPDDPNKSVKDVLAAQRAGAAAKKADENKPDEKKPDEKQPAAKPDSEAAKTTVTPEKPAAAEPADGAKPVPADAPAPPAQPTPASADGGK